MLRVRDIMEPAPEPIPSTMSVLELNEHLKLTGAFSALVTGPLGQPVGIVTRSDLAAFLSHCWHVPLHPHRWLSHDQIAWGVKVDEIMAPFQFFTRENTPLRDLSEAVLERKITRLVVMRGERAVGLISALDLVRGLRQEIKRAC